MKAAEVQVNAEANREKWTYGLVGFIGGAVIDRGVAIYFKY